MKYNEYYSSDYLNPIGITFRGEEKEKEPDDDEQIMMYVDVYTLNILNFIDITNKYLTQNITPTRAIGLIGSSKGIKFHTIGHYEFSESDYWDIDSYRGVAHRAGSGGIYDVGTSAASDGTVQFSDIPTIVASNPEVADSMSILEAYNDRATNVDLFNFCNRLLMGNVGETIFGLFDNTLVNIYNGVGGDKLVPVFDYFTVPTNTPPILTSSTIQYGLPSGHAAYSAIRAKCENGVITFDAQQPWVSTATNFPYDLSPINVNTSMSSTLYMWFKVICLRNISFICTRKEAEKWIADTSAWLASVGLDKGMIQLYLDPHIEDIPDWYKEKLGI